LLFYDPVLAGPGRENHSTLVVRNTQKNHGFSAQGSKSMLTAIYPSAHIGQTLQMSRVFVDCCKKCQQSLSKVPLYAGAAQA
jgi:hypothetical protein